MGQKSLLYCILYYILKKVNIAIGCVNIYNPKVRFQNWIIYDNIILWT